MYAYREGCFPFCAARVKIQAAAAVPPLGKVQLMADPKQLPHLLRLLDDPSETVREAVTHELAAFGPALEQLLENQPQPVTTQQRQVIRRLLGERERTWLREVWPQWYELPGEMPKLETALTFIADFQNGPRWVSLKSLLDDLASEFYRQDAPGDALSLAKFLFERKGIKGAKPDYYSPENSNLVHVIEHKRGIPISLSCIYMLVGARIGLDISGCNWPGHFLARTYSEGKLVLVDCYNGGQVIEEESFLRMQGPSRDAAREVVETVADSETIIARILNNLVRAYELSEHWANRQLMSELLLDLERHLIVSRRH